MKKLNIFISALLICVILLLSACSSTSKSSAKASEIYVGMTRKEYRTVVSIEEELGFYNCMFFVDADGQSVVVRFKDDAIETVSVYPKRKGLPADSDFEQITYGMTIEEVIERVGFPEPSGASGVIVYNFNAKKGETYKIMFNNDTEMKVTSVRLVEE